MLFRKARWKLNVIKKLNDQSLGSEGNREAEMWEGRR